MELNVLLRQMFRKKDIEIILINKHRSDDQGTEKTRQKENLTKENKNTW